MRGLAQLCVRLVEFGRSVRFRPRAPRLFARSVAVAARIARPGASSEGHMVYMHHMTRGVFHESSAKVKKAVADRLDRGSAAGSRSPACLALPLAASRPCHEAAPGPSAGTSTSRIGPKRRLRETPRSSCTRPGVSVRPIRTVRERSRRSWLVRGCAPMLVPPQPALAPAAGERTWPTSSRISARSST
ncbi:MAG: hypothetical protein V7647_3072 [Acidobacteriota bacterium]|jgi:hypothetical protein